MSSSISDRKTGLVTVTVRLIRSFVHRNIKCVVFSDINPDVTVAQFKSIVDHGKFMLLVITV